MLPLRFSERIVLISGAADAIGQAIAMRFASEGARVLIAGDDARGLQTSSALIPGARIISYCNDLDPDACRRLVADAELEFGPIDILVNNPARLRHRPFLEVTVQEFDAQMDFNLKAQFFLAQSVALRMLAQRAGRVIFAISTWGRVGSRHAASVYSASQAGLIAMAKCLALECAPHVLVNCVAHGWIDPTLQPAGLDQPSLPAEVVPLKRPVSPRDVAQAVAWLASDEADCISGETLAVDGGATRW